MKRVNPESKPNVIHKCNFIPRALQLGLNTLQLGVLRYYKDKKIVQLIKQVFKETDCQLKANEAFLIYSLARAQSRGGGNGRSGGLSRLFSQTNL